MYLTRHALEEMAKERPPLKARHVERTLEAPDHDDGHQAWKRIGPRTILVRYAERGDAIWIKTVSATRRALGP